MTHLTDTHCHLSLDPFSGEIESILARAYAAGVRRVVVPGIDLDSSRRAVEIAEAHEGVYASVGVHPHGASTFSQAIGDELRTLARSPEVVAVGEIGLDYYRDLSPRKAQLAAFRDQLTMARDLELPVIIHNREAHEELYQVLLEWAPTVSGSRKGVLHAFSGTDVNVADAVNSGFYIGVAGPLTYPSAEGLRRTIQGVPLDRLLLETDSPHLPPQPYRGQRNEPAYLPLVADELNRLAGRAIDAVTTKNADTLFGWQNGSSDTLLS